MSPSESRRSRTKSRPRCCGGCGVRWCAVGTAPPHPPAWTKTQAELCRAVGKHEKHWATHQAINRLIERGDLYANGKLWSPADRLFEAEEAE